MRRKLALSPMKRENRITLRAKGSFGIQKRAAMTVLLTTLTRIAQQSISRINQGQALKS